MSQVKKDQAVEAESTTNLHLVDDPNEVDFVEAHCPAKDRSDFKKVPEIEIKLESSDEEEDRSEESSTCSAPPQKRKNEAAPAKPSATHHPHHQQHKGHFQEEGILTLMMRPTRKRKSTSEVWQFFSRDPSNICRAICGLCKMSVSRGKLGGNFGTTALKRHLECKHPLEWAQRKSMRLHRAEMEEEEEETYEDEEEKDEFYQSQTNRTSTCSPSPHRKGLQSKDCSFVTSQGPSSPKTYEIIDSSDEEGGGGGHAGGHVGGHVDAYVGGHVGGHTGGYVGGHVGGHTGGHVGGHAGGHVGGHTGGHVGGHTGGHVGGHAGGHVGGHAGGHTGGHVGGHAGGHIGGDAGGQHEQTPENKRQKLEDVDQVYLPDGHFSDLQIASHGLDHAQPSSSVAFTIPDYSAVPLGARRRKSISAVWQFFCLDRTNICRAICNLCQTSVSRGKMGGHFGTSALMRHLEGKHPLEWGRGKFNKMNVTNAIEVEDEEDEEMDGSVTYGDTSFVNFAPSDLMYADMQDVMGQMHYNMAVEYNNEGEEPMVDNSNVSSPMYLPGGAPTKIKPSGKYPPHHPRAQAWNRNITELLCETALPYSFIGSKAFRKFMSRADVQYSVPTKSFFSKKAVPQLYEAVCGNITSQLKKSSCPYIHITAHMWNGDPAAYHLSLMAHWSIMNPDADQPIQRKYAVLCIKSFPKDSTEVSVQQELIRQASLWLTSNGLTPGFFISNRDFHLVQAIKGANCTYIPCLTHSLNLLVKDFLQNNRYIAGMLGVARKVCNHFTNSPRARRVLADLQYQNNLPKQCLKLESVPHWTSTFYMLQRLLEQQKAVQAYFLMHKVDTVDVLLNPSHWNLMLSLVDLLQPFEMATREVNSRSSCLSQVLPELRYLHIFLKKIKGHFESTGDVNGVVIADSLALKLSTDYGVNEMFQKEEYVLATLLDPRFKGRIEAILPPDSDIDHWKQILVKKVKEVMSSSSSTNSSPQVMRTSCQFRDNGISEPEMFSGKMVDLESGGPPWRRSMAAAPLIHKEKSLIEHLESVGLLASKSTGASLSTESHSACVMVEKYLQDNKTIGAKDDPLIYWQKRTWLWPALTKLAVMYLTCPSSSNFAERVFSSPPTSTTKQSSSHVLEGEEHIVFLRCNLENFPDYKPPPLIFLDNEADQSDSDEGL